MKRCVVNSSLEDFESVRRSYKEAVSRRSQQQSVQDEQKQQYRAANKRAEDKIAAEIEKIVRDATSSQFMDKLSVYVNAYAHSQGDVSCTIRVSYGEDYKFDDSTPLVWSWEFEVGKYGRRGEVDRKTSSWSGLNATTLQNIDSLKDSVAALEALAKVDDEYVKSVIYDQAVPYSDYVTQEVDSVDDRDFLARQVDALAGTGLYVVTDEGSMYTDYSRVDKSTAHQYVVTTVRVAKPYRQYNYKTDEYEDVMSRRYLVEDGKRYYKDKFLRMVSNLLTTYTEGDIDDILAKWNKEYFDSKE